MTEQRAPYPVQFSIDYPESSRRVTALFRIVLAVPVLILSALLSGTAPTGDHTYQWVTALYTGGLVWIPTVLMILFRRKYPRWWFDWNLELLRFLTRIQAFVLLLRDDYPSTDEPQGVRIDAPYPDAEGRLNRFLPLVKWILAIPHYIVLAVLVSLVLLATIVAWFAILIAGRYPRELFLFVEGTLRWAFRVTAYAFLLSTDRYPPFRFGA